MSTDQLVGNSLAAERRLPNFDVGRRGCADLYTPPCFVASVLIRLPFRTLLTPASFCLPNFALSPARVQYLFATMCLLHPSLLPHLWLLCLSPLSNGSLLVERYLV